ncbi:hypothetical protein NP233_g5485 [Leucocoprinus birnbaumii]|uniref:Major facilitator superfamily (MFS) profile domain-containing protein n=1 Tax=Leucocoprinus birnbaumii TaxID=56174 RepID=A0AAD5VW94_9AGAR|nr:hypothetical protein NP233_g5485 [Leucocoprinus birnbaumii]
MHIKASSEVSATDAIGREAPPPLRQILIWPVIISVANYVSLAFLDIMLSSLLPLFFAMSTETGGLGFTPPTIGYLLGAYGAVTGIFSIFFSAKMLRYFGEKRVFCGGIAFFVPAFMLMPIMNLLARRTSIGPIVWSLVMFEFLFMILANMAYGAIFIFVTASAPDQRSLGATNGLSQTTVSISRALGPALSTSLFSFSVEHEVLGGYGVYVLMTAFALLALALASLLPPRVWDDEKAPE